MTITIPTYNSELFIVDALRSVLSQTYTVDEILIVDDFSKDNTVKIVRNFVLDNKIINCKIIENSSNLGYAKNWNKCLKLSSSKYTLILHADDILKPNTIKKQLHFLGVNPEVALIGGQEDRIDAKGNSILIKDLTKNIIYPKGNVYEFIKEQNSYIACSSVMFDMDKIESVGYFDEDVIGTDELYWPKILSKYPIAILGESLIDRREHEGQTEFSHFVKYEKDAIKIYNKFKRTADYEVRPHYKKRILKLNRAKFSKSWLSLAFNVMKQGHKRKGINYILKSIYINPSIVFYFPKRWKLFAKMLICLFSKKGV